jgi:hypothetical protein
MTEVCSFVIHHHKKHLLYFCLVPNTAAGSLFRVRNHLSLQLNRPLLFLLHTLLAQLNGSGWALCILDGQLVFYCDMELEKLVEGEKSANT